MKKDMASGVAWPVNTPHSLVVTKCGDIWMSTLRGFSTLAHYAKRNSGLKIILFSSLYSLIFQLPVVVFIMNNFRKEGSLIKHMSRNHKHQEASSL